MSDIVRKSTCECIPAGEPTEAQKVASPASLVKNRVEMKQQDVIEKLDARNKMNETFGVVEGKAFLSNEAQLDGVTSMQYGSSSAGESSNVFIDVGDGQGPAGLGGGKDLAGLYSHRDFKNKDKPKKVTRSSTRGQTNRMKLINALSIDYVPFRPPETLGCGHKRIQPGKEMRLEKLDELRRTTFPPQRIQDAQRDFHDVTSDSNSSAASSVTAVKFFEFVCDNSSSSIEGDRDEGAPACSSIDLGSEGENESVGSSVAESAFEKCLNLREEDACLLCRYVERIRLQSS